MVIAKPISVLWAKNDVTKIRLSILEQRLGPNLTGDMVLSGLSDGCVLAMRFGWHHCHHVITVVFAPDGNRKQFAFTHLLCEK